MALHHEVVDKRTHRFTGLQAHVIACTLGNLQNELDDFMKSPKFGDCAVFETNVTVTDGTATVIIMYAQFTKKADYAPSNYNQNNDFNNGEGDRFSRRREYEDNNGGSHRKRYPVNR